MRNANMIGKKKIKRIVVIVFIVLLFLVLLFRHVLNERPKILLNLGHIDVSEIEKIRFVGISGGIHGNYSCTLSENESRDFIHLLNQVKLGGVVSRSKAASTGAVSYYTLYFREKDPVTVNTGPYFYIDGTYYKFKNYDELEQKFFKHRSQVWE